MASKKEVPSMETSVDDTMELIFDEDDLDIVSFDDAIMEVEPVLEDVSGSMLELAPKASVGMDIFDIADFITPIEDKIKYLTWVVYGKNGTGKTHLLSTVPGMLILAAEDGTLSIRDEAKDARKLKVDTWEKLEAVYWLLAKSPVVTNDDGTTGIELALKHEKFVVKSLGFDTITKLAEVCMRNVVLGEREKDLDKDIIKKTMKNWGDMSEKLKYWLQLFKELPVQKIWLLQEGTNSEDVDSDEFSIFPQVNKSVRTYVMSEADVIARTYIAKTAKGVQFRLSAAPNDKYVTKDRTNKLGIVANPSLNKLYKLVFGKDI